MAEPKFSSIFLIAFFLGTAVSGRLLSGETNKLQLPNEIRGYLEVVLETLETSRNKKLVTDEENNHSIPIQICMASLASSEMVLNECLLTSLDQKVFVCCKTSRRCFVCHLLSVNSIFAAIKIW